MLEIQLKDKILQAVGEIRLTRYMRGNPSNLSVKFRKKDIADIEEGDPIALKYKDNKAFKGYVFNIEESEEDLVGIVAFDQLRYLKNQHTMTIKNKTASDLIKELASEFSLSVGNLENTSVDIAVKQIIVENQSLFEIIYNALDDTMLANKKDGRILEYVLFDNFGKLELVNQRNLNSDVVFDDSNIFKYRNNRSIDGNTYNRILITYKDEQARTVDKFIVKDSGKEKKWGVLQKTFSVQHITKDQAEDWGGKLLKYFGSPKSEFSINTVASDITIRGGTNVYINLDINGKKLHKKLIVDTVVHTFSNEEHTMELKLLGSDS